MGMTQYVRNIDSFNVSKVGPVFFYLAQALTETKTRTATSSRRLS
jgi:hypothetical protein